MAKYPMQIDNATSDAELKRLADNPRILLKASVDFDFSRLPARVSAALETDAETIRAPQLESIASIVASNLKTLDAPRLAAIDTAASFMPSLETSSARMFWAPKARTRSSNLALAVNAPAGALTAG